jgi:hypothetical protein
MSNWARRYASAVCLDCGMQDSGGYQEVRGGKCVDKEVCESRQKDKAENPPAKKKPVKKPRKQPLVNRKKEALCWHPDCAAELKRYPADKMSWEPSYFGKAACSEHWPIIWNAINYSSWKDLFGRDKYR